MIPWTVRKINTSYCNGIRHGEQVLQEEMRYLEIIMMKRHSNLCLKLHARGLNLWDTAAVYGMGDSERILGKLIHYDSDMPFI
ncbi:MAG: hypothetical protein ACLSCV_11040 [Acutalibacteraceae bacterium]